MKKHFLLLLALVMALSLCACDKTDDPKPTSGTTVPTAPTKPVKKEEKVSIPLLTKAKIIDHFGEETETTECILTYDDDYHLIGVNMYQGLRLVCQITYDKDPNHPLVEQTYDEEGNEVYRVEYAYNENGDEVSYAYYIGDELGEEYHYTYDEQGKLLTETYSNVEIRYTYDADGNILSEDTYRDGVRTDGRSYTYRDGKLAEQRDDCDYFWSIRTYDGYGNMVTLTEGNMDTLPGEEIITEYRNTYESGKLVEVKAYQDDRLISHRRCDSAGNDTLYVAYMGEGGAESYREEADFDERGRLIRSFFWYDEGWGMCGENTTTYTYGNNGALTCMRYYSYEELLDEYVPVYETVTVSTEQAATIAKTAEKIYLIPDYSEC